jgi:DNA-binding transcriptional ArsR family regulator
VLKNNGEKMPDYTAAVAVENSLKVLESLSRKGGIGNFSEIQADSGVKGSVLNHHLNRLQKLKVIQREVKGTYRLTFKTPLCLIFNPKQKTQIAYFGLLGRQEERKEPEPHTAIDLLEKEQLKPDLTYVVTSPDALDDWKKLKLPYQWILCYEDEIIDVDAVKRKVIPQLLTLLRDCIVIMDCTSATKPATIAYYELAQKLWIPLIYIYEETKQMKWLISRGTLETRLSQHRNR